MPSTPSGDRLPCGAQVDELLEQVAEGHGGDLTDHQRGCVHCQAALGELQTFWQPAIAAAAVPVEVPTGLTGSIMNAVRRRAQNVWFTFEGTDGGAIRIAARIVAVIARDTARLVPGVRVVLGRTSESRMAALVEKATLGHRHPHSRRRRPRTHRRSRTRRRRDLRQPRPRRSPSDPIRRHRRAAPRHRPGGRERQRPRRRRPTSQRLSPAVCWPRRNHAPFEVAKLERKPRRSPAARERSAGESRPRRSAAP